MRELAQPGERPAPPAPARPHVHAAGRDRCHAAAPVVSRNPPGLRLPERARPGPRHACRWARARISRRPSPKARPWCASVPPSSARAIRPADRSTRSITRMNITAAFIGGGNMGGALIRGLIARGLPRAEHQRRRSRAGAAHRARRRTGRARLCRQSRGRRRCRRRRARGQTAGHGGHGAVRSPTSSRNAPPLVLSIAAGIRVADIAGWCGPGVAVVRAMPNRPALNSAGATAHVRARGAQRRAPQAGRRGARRRGHHGVGARRGRHSTWSRRCRAAVRPTSSCWPSS